MIIVDIFQKWQGRHIHKILNVAPVWNNFFGYFKKYISYLSKFWKKYDIYFPSFQNARYIFRISICFQTMSENRDLWNEYCSGCLKIQPSYSAPEMTKLWRKMICLGYRIVRYFFEVLSHPKSGEISLGLSKRSRNFYPRKLYSMLFVYLA